MTSVMGITQVLATVLFLTANLWSVSATPDVFKRFLVKILNCQECYDCVCKGKWNECGPWPHDWVTNGCPSVIDHSEDCSAPFQQHGGWTIWSHWGHCIGNCGNQHRIRSRACSNPAPKNCGNKCSGSSTEQEACSTHHCGIPAQTTQLAPVTTKTVKTTTEPKTTPVTEPKTTTMTTSTIATTKATTSAALQETVVSHCSKFCTVASVAQNHTANDIDASLCKDGGHTGSEALPIQCCHLDAASTWKRGTNVLLTCNHLPAYVPVAVFDSMTYRPGTSGIFVGCLTDGESGFKFIHQTCDTPPEIVHVSLSNPTYADDTIKFYTIVH